MKKKELKKLKKSISNKEETLLFKIKTLFPLDNMSYQEILDYFNISSLESLKDYIEENYKTPTKKVKKEIRCSCVKKDGSLKKLYKNENLAESDATFLSRKHKIKLKIYYCYEGRGWHLTRG